MSNLTSPSAPGTVDTSQRYWSETVSVFPIYLALAKQLGIAIPFSQRKLPDIPDAELSSQVQSWLDAMDLGVLVYQLRHLLQMTTMNASENKIWMMWKWRMRRTR